MYKGYHASVLILLISQTKLKFVFDKNCPLTGNVCSNSKGYGLSSYCSKINKSHIGDFMPQSLFAQDEFVKVLTFANVIMTFPRL